MLWPRDEPKLNEVGSSGTLHSHQLRAYVASVFTRYCGTYEELWINQGRIDVFGD